MFGVVSLQALLHKGHFFTLDNILKLIAEALLLQNIGIYDGGFNTPLWYFSVLIWGGGGLYALLKYDKKLAINIILPLYVLLFYTYIFSKNDSIECWDKNIFYIPMLRGLADMSVGIISAELSFRIIPKMKKTFLLFDIISVISFIFLIIIFYIEKPYDKFSIIFIPILILNCVSKKGIWYRILNRNYFSKLGGITYEMYLLHLPLLMILSALFKNLEIDNVLRYIIYLLFIMIVSKYMKFGCAYVNKKLYANH